MNMTKRYPVSPRNGPIEGLAGQRSLSPGGYGLLKGKRFDNRDEDSVSGDTARTASMNESATSNASLFQEHLASRETNRHHEFDLSSKHSSVVDEAESVIEIVEDGSFCSLADDESEFESSVEIVVDEALKRGSASSEQDESTVDEDEYDEEIIEDASVDEDLSVGGYYTEETFDDDDDSDDESVDSVIDNAKIENRRQGYLGSIKKKIHPAEERRGVSPEPGRKT
mmetsp:Transcript_24266/g.36848  ORF Transcript_24266/g.36848 Transcript_24266/m.36848 type:complete len:226 (-) Transcript_24266:12-689(-)